MRAQVGRPRALLVVAPHPDDEAIAAHALIARLARRATRVAVLVVSDGAASHPGSRAWPRARLVRERRRETRLVMRRIGVAAGAITFLDLPDGRLADYEGAVRRGIRRAVDALPAPLLALAPLPGDAHPDHRVVAAAARHGPGVRWWRYPVWPAGQRLRGARALPLSAQERLAKRHAIRGYRTQAGRITDDPNGFAMTARQIAAFSRPRELFATATVR
ncbi:PIG-L deacetylase family protein [Sphingomonas sp. BK580]|uniref:PIG-L deacetylase family protein n=1 Tax=Sphingomonas sp. BK580 TaxID=2586972 RepID=UPI001621EE47|nr:PIG-L family deacetylase [Sphingomonas sp. BK580]MBB3691967.1 LmbE family N-acetylglucosaminyl deacetylase [Sphingomonas sp. BK580]